MRTHIQLLESQNGWISLDLINRMFRLIKEAIISNSSVDTDGDDDSDYDLDADSDEDEYVDDNDYDDAPLVDKAKPSRGSIWKRRVWQWWWFQEQAATRTKFHSDISTARKTVVLHIPLSLVEIYLL